MKRTLLTFSLIAACALLAPASAQTTSRVSIDSSAGESNGISAGASVSAAGRYVVFSSVATDLVASDTNGSQDVFGHDRQSGTTVLFSLDSAGNQGNGHSTIWSGPAISSSGRYVVFTSLATNLVSGDTNGVQDVFVRDTQSGTTTRVSVDSNGTEGNGSSFDPSISPDGRFVVFHSAASNLVTGDSNGFMDVFVRDLQNTTTIRVSLDSTGSQGNGSSSTACISDDGAYVAFMSEATNLVASDTNGALDVFLHTIASGQTIRISVDSAGAEGDDDSSYPSMSANGAHISFMSYATNLVTGDNNGVWDCFVYESQTAITTRVSVDSAAGEGNDDSTANHISADGRFVAFTSLATDLVAGDTNGVRDSFIHDRLTGSTSRVSVDSSGTQGNGSSPIEHLSADGRYVVFSSSATNLVASDTNGVQDVFVHDLGTNYPMLLKSGVCSGVLTLDIYSATPNGQVAIIYGNPGTSTKPGNPCMGTLLNIAATVNLLATVTANGAGVATYQFNAASVCGLTSQVVDVSSCLTSFTIIY